MKVLYVSGKYSDSRGAWFRDQNIRRAGDVAAEIWGMEGLCAICPHLNTAHMDGVADYGKFIDGDKAIIKGCDGLVMLPGWKTSNGACEEEAEARRLGLPVFEWPHHFPLIRWWGRNETTDELLVVHGVLQPTRKTA